MSHAHAIICLHLAASIGGIVSCLFLVGACRVLYKIRLGSPIVLGRLLGDSMLPGLLGSARIAVVWLLQMKSTWYLNVQLSTRLAVCSFVSLEHRHHEVLWRTARSYAGFPVHLMSSQIWLLSSSILASNLSHCNCAGLPQYTQNKAASSLS